MTWQAGGSIGERVGAEAKAAHNDQRALAMRSLSQSEGSLFLVSEKGDELHVVVSFFLEDATGEEHRNHKSAFLQAVREAIDELEGS